MLKKSLICLSILALSALSYSEEKKITMVDPVIDEKGPFGYLAIPNNEMAMMGARNGFQLTYDGAIYNRENEFNLYVGDPVRPIMARLKTMLNGYIPVFSFGENAGDIRYDVESFAWNPDGNSLEPAVAFIRVKVTNTGKTSQKGNLAAGFRANGELHRFAYKAETFQTGWMYEMPRDRVIRNGQVIALLPKGDKQEAVPGSAYPGKAFNGDDFRISGRAEYGLTYYTPTLAPGQSKTYDFKFPYRSIFRDSNRELQKLEEARYDTNRTRCVEFWTKEIAKGMQVHFPEAKANEAWKANLVYDMMAIWSADDGKLVPGVNKFQYNWFWLRDGGYIVRAFDLWGHTELASKLLEYFPQFQKENGNFESQSHQTDGFGQALFAMCQHALLTGDKTYAEKVYTHIPKAIEFLEKTRRADSLGLLPPTEAGDNELIKGHYTGHNFWALLGVRMAQRTALMLGKDKDAAQFKTVYDEYYTSFSAALEKVTGKDGYIPPGLDAEGGQDWGNFLGVYPSEVLSPSDPRIKASLDKVRKDKYAEGVMTYCGDIHQYVTVKVAQNFVYRGEQEEALKDYYGLLLHTGSAHEMFEWQAQVYGNRNTGKNFSPHGWGSAMLNLLTRNMLIQEREGKAGLAPRNIHLFTVLSPEWVKSGQSVSFENAPTDHGIVSASANFNAEGAAYKINAKWRTEPAAVVIHIPWFVEYASSRSDAKTVRREGDKLIFSPDVTEVDMKWTRKQNVPAYSFEKTVADYKAEYKRRYAEYIKAGNKPDPVEAPQILTPEERNKLFDEAKKESK